MKVNLLILHKIININHSESKTYVVLLIKDFQITDYFYVR